VTGLVRLLRFLGSAEHHLDICVYTITLDAIADKIIDMAAAGIRVIKQPEIIWRD
jgi:hypothetical protein